MGPDEFGALQSWRLAGLGFLYLTYRLNTKITPHADRQGSSWDTRSIRALAVPFASVFDMGVSIPA